MYFYEGYAQVYLDESSGGLRRRVLLDLMSLVRLFALQIRQHQFAQFHQLLDLLFGDLIRNLQRLHSSVSCFGHHAQIGEDGLLVQ